MKSIKIFLVLLALMVSLGIFAKDMSVQSGSSTIKLGITAPIGTTFDFTQPDNEQITTTLSGTLVEMSYVNVGGALLYFTVSVPSTSSATKVEIVQTGTQFRESYSLENGQATVQTFVPLSSSNSVQWIYIIVS